ncbi:putative hscarg dehydrogenase, partial [Aulographum hederae CBS 113979]
SVASTFTHLLDCKIRGITRNPSSATSQSLISRGIEIVQGDLDDPSSLSSAFRGATAIFAVTDFWAHFFATSTADAAAASGKRINETAFDAEVRQGRNIADAAAGVEVLRTLERFVFSSLADVGRWSGGKYRNVYHFDSKAVVESYIRGQKMELAERMSTVLIGNYVTNWRGFPKLMAPQKTSAGDGEELEYVLRKPEDLDTMIPLVETKKDTGAFVKALIEDLPIGTSLLGVSEMMSWKQFMEIWGRVLGVKARMEKISMEEWLEPLPEHLREEVGESYAFNAEFGWTGGDPGVKLPGEVGVNIRTTGDGGIYPG